ncbi:hypothetical protein [Pelagibaculum spongiae]|uniref:Uncharacterized protein n=1 Tax=Pelagibaculum spongiae TaxID=2080658 RepID=A0A2V1GXK1_9GAMM|nr:hypothetical protein [Pelagibaculum spongiae]PVZ71824.1 hypothetical protein DC094_02010 [Pelagibaculum spongiae]
MNKLLLSAGLLLASGPALATDNVQYQRCFINGFSSYAYTVTDLNGDTTVTAQLLAPRMQDLTYRDSNSVSPVGYRATESRYTVTLYLRNGTSRDFTSFDGMGGGNLNIPQVHDQVNAYMLAVPHDLAPIDYNVVYNFEARAREGASTYEYRYSTSSLFPELVEDFPWLLDGVFAAQEHVLDPQIYTQCWNIDTPDDVISEPDVPTPTEENAIGNEWIERLILLHPELEIFNLDVDSAIATLNGSQRYSAKRYRAGTYTKQWAVDRINRHSETPIDVTRLKLVLQHIDEQEPDVERQ